MRLVSYYGNEVVITEDERKIERFKALGFKEIVDKQELPKKEGAKKNGDGKRKTKSPRDI